MSVMFAKRQVHGLPPRVLRDARKYRSMSTFQWAIMSLVQPGRAARLRNADDALTAYENQVLADATASRGWFGR